ncbi:hypothetical protein K491DRAFT_313408 [Lophiostoma macrostomum CBS 122681]|uniref:Uncharacterized protein n=1 Tax=Lophiostoma macrostomum CBS 122681 TaxID=1314788 RepID=A0A6A6SK57_9PLEO|nr:hypothetical protein K491DRAFT_313408 [Lophiostoma macrostomum CBS 122681]
MDSIGTLVGCSWDGFSLFSCWWWPLPPIRILSDVQGSWVELEISDGGRVPSRQTIPIEKTLEANAGRRLSLSA